MATTDNTSTFFPLPNHGQESSFLAAPRQRIARACDQCFSRRSRCDGQLPCQSCTTSLRNCRYTRQVKRRGRKAAKPSSQQNLLEDILNSATDEDGDNFLSTSGSGDRCVSRSCASLPRQLTSNHTEQLTYLCLKQVCPQLLQVIDLSTAYCLLDAYFAPPDVSPFAFASPYVLTPVLRRRSMRRQNWPRRTWSGLIWTILWVCSLTTTVPALVNPRQRKLVCNKLEKAVMAHLAEVNPHDSSKSPSSCWSAADELLACILVAIVVSGGDTKADTLLWYHRAIRLAKSLALHQIDASTEASPISAAPLNCCEGQHLSNESHLIDDCTGLQRTSNCAHESREEMRRLFWLLYSLDRHWALSYNSSPLIQDQDCKVHMPIAEALWISQNLTCQQLKFGRVPGPQTTVTGFSFFDSFLPLMTIVGDVIWSHHQRCHPRLHHAVNANIVAQIELLLAQTFQQVDDLFKSLSEVEDQYSSGTHVFSAAAATTNNDNTRETDHITLVQSSRSSAFQDLSSTENFDREYRLRQCSHLYVVFILHVFHVLLHGRWDALDLLSQDDGITQQPCSPSHNGSETENIDDDNPMRMHRSDWITSHHYTKCAAHAIAASETLSNILSIDPELAYMPYLFGIYLLHGSFVLLFFADRLTEVGESSNSGAVERACEIIIRAHEVSFVTLSVEFQRDFRRIIRGRLYAARNHKDKLLSQSSQSVSSNHSSHYQHGSPFDTRQLGNESSIPTTQSYQPGAAVHDPPEIWRELLKLYRWNNGSDGLAI